MTQEQKVAHSMQNLIFRQIFGKCVTFMRAYFIKTEYKNIVVEGNILS
jgi:hypothetical protein